MTSEKLMFEESQHLMLCIGRRWCKKLTPNLKLQVLLKKRGLNRPDMPTYIAREFSLEL